MTIGSTTEVSVLGELPVRDEQNCHGDKFGQSDDERIEHLLDQLGEGFRADDATNFEKLQIAMKYGPMLLELKEISPHGTYLVRLQERFPKVSVSKCYRWMWLARHDAEVSAAIKEHSDVAWGPKKMSDFLKGKWPPESVEVDSLNDEDEEEECGGFVKDECEDVDVDFDEAQHDSPVESEDESDIDHDPTENWECTASDAEREAAAVDCDQPAVVEAPIFTLRASVTTEVDLSSIRDALSDWSPITTTTKNLRTVAAAVRPTDMATALANLDWTWIAATKMRVTIEP